MEAPHDPLPAAPEPTAAPSGSARTEVTVTVESAERMLDFGRRLAALLRPGDLVLLTGELGAGKTTLTRGLGEGLGVRGAVTSPTFVIARVHPPLVDAGTVPVEGAEGRPPLVHVDAYRLGGGLEEMEDLDLDVSLPESVVVVEWGEGRVEELAEDRLHVVIERALGSREGTPPGTPSAPTGPTSEAVSTESAQNDAADGTDGADGVRRLRIAGVGARWAGVRLPEA